MLSKKNRISNRHLINKLLRKGRIYQSDNFTVKYLPATSEDSKFAIVTSKKISKKAVVRNKLRRQITESIRLNINVLKSNIVAVLITKPSIVNLKYEELAHEIELFLNQDQLNVQ